jgi:type II secretory pathway component PulJ
MNNQSGFSVVELVAALFILSASLVAIGEVISLISKNWNSINSDLAAIETLQDSIAQIEEIERQFVAENRAIQIHSRDKQAGMVLAIPRIEQRSDCRYDLVGRRCR